MVVLAWCVLIDNQYTHIHMFYPMFLHPFHLFDSLTIQAFNMIDQNRDGFIDNEDLKDMLASLGQPHIPIPSTFAPLLPYMA